MKIGVIKQGPDSKGRLPQPDGMQYIDVTYYITTNGGNCMAQNKIDIMCYGCRQASKLHG